MKKMIKYVYRDIQSIYKKFKNTNICKHFFFLNDYCLQLIYQLKRCESCKKNFFKLNSKIYADHCLMALVYLGINGNAWNKCKHF